MKNKKTFLILGLGIFGSTIAKELAKYGNDVIVVDKDMKCIDRLVDFVSHGVCCDFNDITNLKNIGIDEIDCAIIATSSHLDEVVMAVMNLKELNVPMIIGKAKNKKYANVLLKVGCDKVITPEKEMGIKIAKHLSSEGIVDLIEVDKEFNIVEIKVPNSFVNKNLIELDLRNKYNINVIGVRNSVDDKLNLNVNPNETIKKDDHLLIIVDNISLKKVIDFE